MPKVGAAVVVITLIYLAVQLRQNNELLRSESRRAIMDNEQSALRSALEYEDVLRKLDQPGELSAKEQFQLSILFVIDLENRFFEYRQYQNGVLDEATWLSHQHIIVENHAKGRGRDWWNKVGCQFYDDKFVEVVDQLLRDEESVGGYRLFSTWDDEKEPASPE